MKDKPTRKFLGTTDYETMKNIWIQEVAAAIKRDKPEEAPTLREVVNLHKKALKEYLRGNKSGEYYK